MSISQLCISVPLSTSCTDFTVNSKFSANRGSYLQRFSWLKLLCRLFSVSCNRMQVITNKYTRIHLSTEWGCLFPGKFDRLCFSKASGRDSKQNRIFLRSNSLRSRDVHSTPSWHKWSDFACGPCCLAIIVRTPPESIELRADAVGSVWAL